MVYQRAFAREFLIYFGLCFIATSILAYVIKTNQLLADAGMGSAQLSTSVLVISLHYAGYLPVIISLSLYLSFSATLARIVREREHLMWAVLGLKQRLFMRSAWLLTIPFVVLIAICSIVISPWAEEKAKDVMDAERFQKIESGSFNEVGDYVFYIDKDGRNRLNNFFAYSQLNNGQVMVIKSQNMDIDKSAITVRQGHWYRLGNEGYEKASFDVLHANRGIADIRNHRLEWTSAELFWRWGIVISAAVLLLYGYLFALLEVGFVSVTSMIFLSYAGYNNLISIFQHTVALGYIGLLPAMALVHGGVVLVALLGWWWIGRKHPWRS